MGTLSMREILPDRRRNWTQHVHIGGHSIYLTVGEYEDGRPGEIFVDMSRQGTLLKGVMGALARMVSISLQCGAGIDLIVHALRGLDYPPAGAVDGSDLVKDCLSVTDWIASELEARYVLSGNNAINTEPSAEGDVKYLAVSTPDPDCGVPTNQPLSITPKAAGYTPEVWRTGI